MRQGATSWPDRRDAGLGGASRLRVSDAERDAVAAELAEHLKEGRLQLDEFDERVGEAVGARTRGDLDRLLADLPRPAPERPPSRRRPGPPVPVTIIAVVVTGMAVAGGISRAAGGGGHPPWAFLWLWWLLPMAIFAARRRLRGSQAPEGR
jgi:hypothetical protein